MDPYSDSWRLRSNRMDEPANSSQRNSVLPENMMKVSKTAEKRKSSSCNDAKDENSDAILDRRLTIHCIVEEITSLEENCWQECSHNCCNSNKNGRENNKWWHCECRNIEMNSCVVIKANTAMSDLVKSVLTKLGYPSNASSSAMGSILVRNWKALSLSTICPNPKMSVGDVLGELSSLVTLQIQILRPKSAVIQEIKDRLLGFLIGKSHAFLTNSGCPLDLLMLTKLCEESGYVRKYGKEESCEEMQQRFEIWLNHMHKSEMLSRGINNGVINNNDNHKSSNNFDSNMKQGVDKTLSGAGPNNAAVVANASSFSLGDESPTQTLSDNEYKKEGESRGGKNISSGFELSERSERSVHCNQTKTRMRTSFDPDLELPKLLKWYLENPHPTRQQIHEYVQELNSLESRRGRKKLDMNNVVYWFKNARAAQKRSEYRKFCNIPIPVAKKNTNLLKIPLGKSSASVLSDEHVTLSDEEHSNVIGNVNAFLNEKGKCMQVLGNWNSNGAGEAVLEMQITPPQVVQQPPPQVKLEAENLSDNEDSSTEGMLSIVEESQDNAECNSGDENEGTHKNEMKDVHKSADTSDTNPPEKEIFYNEKARMISERQEEEEKEEEEEGEGGGGGGEGGGGEVEEDGEEEEGKDGKEDDNCMLKFRNKSLSTQKKLNGFDNSDMSILSRYKSVPQNSILRQSFLYMSQCMNAKLSNLPLSSEERRKRNRTFIDPLTEVPRLEQWFQLSTHPSHSLIVRYTEELNGMPYRKKFPKLETKNVQFWFKNRRAKNKRLNYLDSSNFLR